MIIICGKTIAEVERDLEMAKMAIASPLLETSISGANGILVSITVSPGVELDEADQASTMITEEAAANANIIAIKSPCSIDASG